MKEPKVTLGGFLDKRIIIIKADFDQYGLTDIPSWRNKLRVNAMREMRTLDLSTFQWAALRDLAQEMFKDNRTVGGGDAGSHSASGDATSDPAQPNDSESQKEK